eukprot:GHVU01198640.1.p4 GENE.GHVU01198640.1~~GHVU01198640.1.p4  ORF type:complete len:104 (-),score=18.55 GHVU01198640.1:355-666(-)
MQAAAFPDSVRRMWTRASRGVAEGSAAVWRRPHRRFLPPSCSSSRGDSEATEPLSHSSSSNDQEEDWGEPKPHWGEYSREAGPGQLQEEMGERQDDEEEEASS